MCRRCEVRIAKILDANPNMLVPYYLLLSYIYYEQDESITSDGFYDDVCSSLRKKWNNVEHRHKHLVDKSTLKSGSGFYLHGKFPGIVKGSGNSLIVRCKKHRSE